MRPQLKLAVQYACDEYDRTQLPSPDAFRKWIKVVLRVDSSITVRIVGRDEATMLNQQYRHKNYAPNVLSFTLAEMPDLTGDIVLCAPVVLSEARAQHKTVFAHYAHLTIHGVLHIHGYDHQNSPQTKLMESIEITALHKLGYANPYEYALC